MSKNKKQPKENLIPLPILVNNGDVSWLYTIIKNLMSSLTHQQSERRPTGVFLAFGKFVWIQQQDHSLYQQGHFGKGNLSRSEPTWWSRLEQVHQVHDLTPEQITVERRKQRRQQQKNKRTQKRIPVTLSSNDITTAHDLNDDSYQQRQEDQWTLKQLSDWAQGETYEQFQLDLFEAFFLVYGLDVLDIVDKDGHRLGIDECWTTFSDTYSWRQLHSEQLLIKMDSMTSSLNAFAVQYAAYHYYRSQGWIPKDGLKFGVDFVLYQFGPTYRHAEFAVVVIPCTTSSTSPRHQQHTIPYTWTHLLSLNRVCNQVKKTLVLCYVTLPTSDSRQLSSLDHCSVREVIMKRWSPGSNRD